MVLDISIPSRIEHLVLSGVITGGIHATKYGTEKYVRCVQPHPRLGVTDTSKSMTFEEAMVILDKVTTAPAGSVPKQEPFRKMEKSITSYQAALEYSNTHNVRTYNNNGLENQLPKASLSWADLKSQSKPALETRIILVAKEIGGPKAVQRISSQLTLAVSNARNLEEWWKSASNEQRFTLLTTSKLSGTVPSRGVKTECLDRLSAVKCPFRADTALETPANEETSGEESSDADSGVRV
jgi:hypothetical protein